MKCFLTLADLLRIPCSTWKGRGRIDRSRDQDFQYGDQEDEASRVMLTGHDTVQKKSAACCGSHGLQQSKIMLLVLVAGGGCLLHETNPSCKACTIIMPKPVAQLTPGLCWPVSQQANKLAWHVGTQAARLAAYCGQD